MTQKKVIIIAQNFKPEAVGGASRIYEMARLLRRQFHQINIICPPPTYPFGKYKRSTRLLSKESFDELQIVRLWTFQPSKSARSSFQRILYYGIFSITAFLYLITNCHDASHVIVSVPPSTLLTTTLVARLFRKKLVIDVRDIWVEAATSLGYIKKDSIIVSLVRKFEEYCWRHADTLLTNSMIIHDLLSKALNEDKMKIKYFPFNVDLDIFRKFDTAREKQIVYIGNFGVAQNLQAFISAIPLILNAFPDLKIRFYGGGDCEEDIRHQVKDLGLERSIKIHDPVPREMIPEILSRSMIGIIPLADHAALRYAIPTKAFEYFASRLPVVAYGSSEELERVIRLSNAGIHVRGNSPQSIANAVINLLGSELRLEEYASNGRRFVEQRAVNTTLLE